MSGEGVTGPVPQPNEPIQFFDVRRDDQALTELVGWLTEPGRRQAATGIPTTETATPPSDPALAALAALWDELDDGRPADLDQRRGSRPAVSLPAVASQSAPDPAVSLPTGSSPAVSLPSDFLPSSSRSAVSLPAEPRPAAVPAAEENERLTGQLRPGARRFGSRGVAVAAALAALASMGGVAAAATVAGPGSTLWGLHEALLGPDDSAAAAQEVRVDLDAAQRALDDGSLRAAGVALERAAGELGAVGTRNGLVYLRGRLTALQRRLALLIDVPVSVEAVPGASEPVRPEPAGLGAGLPGPATDEAKPAPADATGKDGQEGKEGKDGRHTADQKSTGSGGRGDSKGVDSKSSDGKSSDGHSADSKSPDPKSPEPKGSATPRTEPSSGDRRAVVRPSTSPRD